MWGRHWVWTIVATPLAIVGAGAAEAHTLGPAAAGFSAGLVHPLLGFDHLLAMIAIGLWATQLAERTSHAAVLWLVPAAFIATMAIGALIALLGFDLPLVETGIVGSVIVLGLLIAATPRLPIAAGIVLAAFFAMFHGHAHGGELPPDASAPLYALGFLLATTFLHGVGITLGLILQGGRLAPRLGGVGIAVAGVALYILG